MRRRAAIVTLGVGLFFLQAQGRASEDDSSLMLDEKLGVLQIDLRADLLKPQLGTPSRRGKEWLSPATGEYEERWEYPNRGVVITLSGKKGQADKKILRIEAFPPCKLATTRGIRLGSAVAEVRKAYASDLVMDRGESTPPRLLAGSRYGGILFDIAAGKVSRIYLGPLAE